LSFLRYGEGEEVAAGEVVVLIVVLVSVLVDTVGDGFTTVVLVSDFFSAGGVTVSVFCSHAASRDAAPARMQMYFFISCDGRPDTGSHKYSVQACISALPTWNYVEFQTEAGPLKCGFKWKPMRLSHGAEGELAVPGVDATGKRRLFLASALEPEIGE